ncbi:MAG: creatininase family protein [Thermomicrobiales bacterium]|nr:creatininase family protein [Thermomicrobiales bacterium]
MPDTTLFQELTREALNARARAGAIVVLPTGATEQHGPHLPVGTDTYAVEHIVRRAAATIAGQVPVIVAPTVPFGCSPHHLPFGGTLSFSTSTYYALLTDLMESLITDGFTRAMIVNGHGGNHEIIQLVVRDLALKHPVNLAAASYWQMAGAALQEISQAPGGRTPGHAGHFETAVIMALQPDLVVEPRPARTDDPSVTDPAELTSRLRIERHGSWQHFDGYTDSPATASAELGHQYVDSAVAAVADAIVQFDRQTSVTV